MRNAIREDKTNLDKKDVLLLRKFVDLKKNSFCVVDVAMCNRVPFLRNIPGDSSSSSSSSAIATSGNRGGIGSGVAGNSIEGFGGGTAPSTPNNNRNNKGKNKGKGSNKSMSSRALNNSNSAMNSLEGNNNSNILNESSMHTNSYFNDNNNEHSGDFNSSPMPQQQQRRGNSMLDSDMGGGGGSHLYDYPPSVLLENSVFLKNLREINRIDANIATLTEMACGGQRSSSSSSSAKNNIANDTSPTAISSPKPKPRNDKNSKLIEAMGYVEKASQILDSSRYFFEAAVIFDDIKMYDRSIDCFKRATIKYPADAIVAEYDQPFTELVRRKIERMSKNNLDGWFQKRESDKVRFIAAEEERQRLRAMVSYCQLVRLYFIIEDISAAHDALCKAFRHCHSTQERNEILWYLHATIKAYNDNGVGDFGHLKQILWEQRGIIAEAHLKMLHELEKLHGGEGCSDLDLLHWIAYRYAEKTDFKTSKAYFLKIRGIVEPDISDQELLRKYLIRPRGLNEAELQEVLNKHILNRISSDQAIDEKLVENRDDWIGFYSKHHAIHVRYYESPGQGWEEGAKGQQRLLELKEQAFKLPDIITLESSSSSPDAAPKKISNKEKLDLHP